MIESKHRDESCDVKWKKYQHSPAGKVLAGIWVVIIGAVLLSRQLGVEYPEWLFSWPSIIIAVGIYIGARHLFCNPGWVILVTIGSLFLIDFVSPEISLSTYIWPVIVILIGIAMIFKPSRRRHLAKRRDAFKYYHEQHYNRETVTDNTREPFSNESWRERRDREQNAGQDYLDTVSVFSAVHRNILSKTFKGGEVTCVLGGAEINLLQADISGRVVLDVTLVLGGTKLIIPSNWDVQPEMIAILGGIEDKREQNATISPDKVLVIRGTSVLGGIEIKSF